MEAIETKEDLLLASQAALEDMEREYFEIIEDDEEAIIY